MQLNLLRFLLGKSYGFVSFIECIHLLLLFLIDVFFDIDTKSTIGV